MTFHRTNINLYQSDVDFLISRYGYGWTERVREIVHDRVRELESNPPPKYLSDLFPEDLAQEPTDET